jgi:hypothetical protein
MRSFLRQTFLILPALALAGCAMSVFAPETVSDQDFVRRGLTQSMAGITVTAAVPTAAEFEALTGLEPYDDGIQPLWLSVDNARGEIVRVAYSSVDPNYYSPLEVAWKYRGDVRGQAETDLERWFHDTKLPRGIAAHSKASGFLYTHAVEGTKGFNLDVFWVGGSTTFTFFVPHPDFAPDYMSVDFDSLYTAADRISTDRQGLRALIEQLPATTTDATGKLAGSPLNVVVVGSGIAVLRSLLRGGWQEQEAGTPATRLARAHYYRGRPPDGVFHKRRERSRERKELRLWLTPVTADGQPVWIGQVNYELSGRIFFHNAADYRVDPDLDDARMFLLQNFLYSQSLVAIGLARGATPVPVDEPRTDFQSQEYFTDGRRAVLFVGDDPVGMDETEILGWEAYFAQ